MCKHVLLVLKIILQIYFCVLPYNMWIIVLWILVQVYIDLDSLLVKYNIFLITLKRKYTNIIKKVLINTYITETEIENILCIKFLYFCLNPKGFICYFKLLLFNYFCFFKSRSCLRIKTIIYI